MPCAAPSRNNLGVLGPCGYPNVQAVAGVDVSAQNLCYPHYALKWGQAGIPKGLMGGIDADTVFCFHADSLADTQGHPLAVTGNVTPAAGQFGGSYLFAGGYISSPDSPDWAFGRGDFTVDFWVRFTAVAVPQVIVGQRATNDFGWTITFIAPGNIRFMYSVDGVNPLAYAPPWTPVAGTWYHVALVRSGPTLRFFVNGTQVGTDYTIGTQVIWDASGIFQLGAELGGSTLLGGNLDELRISKVARWTSNFAVPTAPYT